MTNTFLLYLINVSAGLNEAKTLTQKAIDELPVKFEQDPTGESFGKISKKVTPEEKKAKEEEEKKVVSSISLLS